MNNPKILFVDDEESIRKLIKKQLEKHEIITDTAVNGDEAIKMITNNHYDFVITDFIMPGSITGLELIKKIKKISPNTEIISISGWADGISKDEIIQNGALCFLIKPFKINDLLGVINK